MPRLSTAVLDAPFPEPEIRRAVSELPTEKAPGHGFIGLFYKSCWDIVRADAMAAFQCLYNLTTGSMPKLNGALITLLSKKEPAELPS
jgi:hypothetical protein